MMERLRHDERCFSPFSAELDPDFCQVKSQPPYKNTLKKTHTSDLKDWGMYTVIFRELL